MLEFKLYYWFDFNFALSLVLASAKHNYTSDVTGRVDVNMFRLGLELRYYFDTQDAAAGVTFANPHLIGGIGSYTKTQSVPEGATQTTVTGDQDASFGFCLGFGLEFPIVHRKSYFALEGKFHMVSFRDTNTALFANDGIPDQSGGFYTVGGNILFTW